VLAIAVTAGLIEHEDALIDDWPVGCAAGRRGGFIDDLDRRILGI
jgi:hypothetical protein